MRRRRRARKARTTSLHLSLSATDAEWEIVRANAARRRLSIARYLVGLVDRDGLEEEAGPALALDAEEQRELLGAVREVRALILEGADAAPLVRDMQERIAVQFAAWAGRWPGRGARKRFGPRSPRCWAGSGRASSRPRSCPRT